MDTEMSALSASELADLAGVTEAEVDRMVGLGILVTRGGAGPFRAADAQKIRLATACEQAGLQMGGSASAIRAGRGSFAFLEDAPLLAIYRRQQELVWTEDLVERIESELDAAGVLGRPGRVPAMSFLDLVGYTRLTEEQGDAAAAELAGTLGVLVDRSSREHGGVPVKWLGDGVMVHFGEPAGAVRSALHLVEQLPRAGLPPAHVGVAAGPVVVQGGDYFGRTVNLAARIAARAGAGQVLVSDSVVESASPTGVSFVERGRLRFKGITRPVRVLEAHSA